MNPSTSTFYDWVSDRRKARLTSYRISVMRGARYDASWNRFYDDGEIRTNLAEIAYERGMAGAS